MKKLLTIIFMAALTMSAFATVNVETTSPSVNHDGACERVGTIRFIPTNPQDYQSASTTNPVMVKIQLTDGATLCHDLDGVDDAYNTWIQVEVDGNFWVQGDVWARGFRGHNYVEVLIQAAPYAVNTPTGTDQAWAIIGNTEAIGTGIPNTTFKANYLCFNFSAHPGGVDQFPSNAFNKVSIVDYASSINFTLPSTLTYQPVAGDAVTYGSQLGTSYSPADPAVAYGAINSEGDLNVSFDKNCDGYKAAKGYLCGAIDITDQDTTDPQNPIVNDYDCKCVYRYVSFNSSLGCFQITLPQGAAAAAGSIVEVTVVDSSGNPLSNADHGVYFYYGQGAGVTAPSVSGISNTIQAPAVYGQVDYTDASSTQYYGTCNPDNDGYEDVGDTYADQDMYSAIRFQLGAAMDDSTVLKLSNITLARSSCDDPIDAYLKVAIYPNPCGTGRAVVLTDAPIHFLACPGDAPEVLAFDMLYWPYFPALNSNWWAGLAVTNVSFVTEGTYYSQTAGWAPATMKIQDQDVAMVYYLIEADGDIYAYQPSSLLPKGGIQTILLNDITPVLVSGTDSTFGDERFWVVGMGQGTVNNKAFRLDGFGMLGDGTQAQGFLPRIYTGNFDWSYNGFDQIFNKK